VCRPFSNPPEKLHERLHAIGTPAFLADWAIGRNTLFNNMTGNFNTATGVVALANSNGDYNTGTGYHALLNNGSGTNNIASGAFCGR
jgi:hypothetical protein